MSRSNFEEKGVKATLIKYLTPDEPLTLTEDLAIAISKDCKVDLNIWKIKSHRITGNIWTVNGKFPISDGSKLVEWSEATNSQLKIIIDYERIISEPIQTALQDFIKDIPTFNCTDKPSKFKAKGDICLEIAPLDAHIGKLAWLWETLYRNYDTNLSLEDLSYVIDKHLEWGSLFKPSVIEYVLGQDMFHVDNMASHTTGGDHTLDVDGRITKILQKSLGVILKSVYKCRQVAPVKIRWVPGNHDFFASFALASILKEHFRNDKYVEVDITNASRKAVLWGNLLVGWTHRIVGRHNTWGNELAQAFPELWGKSKFREWHHGDQHKKQNVKAWPVFTSGGVLCRQLTALSPVDKWHFENLYTDAIPGGESFLWSKDMGVFANFIAWIGQYEENRNKLVKMIK